MTKHCKGYFHELNCFMIEKIETFPLNEFVFYLNDDVIISNILIMVVSVSVKQ